MRPLHKLLPILKKIAELESRTSTLEDDLPLHDQSSSQHDAHIASLREKLDDLENKERRNNICFIGIPESIGPNALVNCLAVDLPAALNLQLPVDLLMVERAYRLAEQL